jgi:hypothetical protein
MSYSVTGFAYLTFFLALGFLAYRFFQYWKKEKDLVSKLLLFFVSLFALFALVKAIGGLFFTNNQNFLAGTTNVGAFIQALAFAVIAYFIVYIKFPQISPWRGFISILILGLVAAVFTVATPSSPFLEESGAINWGFRSDPFAFTMSTLRLFSILVVFIPMIIILLQQFKISKDPYVKKKSIGIVFSLIFALFISLLDFLLVSFLKVDPIWRDIGYIAISVTLLITLILTLPRPTHHLKYESKS